MQATASLGSSGFGPKSLSLGEVDFLTQASFALARGEPIGLQVEGYSMWPTIFAGEPILIERIEPSQVEVGDVVLYRSLSDTALIHRVIWLEDTNQVARMITQGDGCSISNIPVPVERVLGYVVAVERAGEWLPLSDLESNKEALWRLRLSRK